MNIGHSSRLGYDKCAYDDRLSESTSPLMYRLNPTQIANCDGCLSVFGPRAGRHGVSTSPVQGPAITQELVDVESVLSNRNVLQSKCKNGSVNEVDVTKFRLQHAGVCNKFLDPVSSRHTNPVANYRGVGVNRFHDLSRNPQKVIFWPFAVNTQLEAKDNHRERIPALYEDETQPREVMGTKKACTLSCHGGNCGQEGCVYTMYGN